MSLNAPGPGFGAGPALLGSLVVGAVSRFIRGNRTGPGFDVIRPLLGGAYRRLGARAAVAPTVTPTPTSVPPFYPPVPTRAPPPPPPPPPDDIEFERTPGAKKPPKQPKAPKPVTTGGLIRGNIYFYLTAYGIDWLLRTWGEVIRRDKELQRELAAAEKRYAKAKAAAEAAKAKKEADQNAARARAESVLEEVRRRDDAKEIARQVAREVERDRILAEPIVITAKRVPTPAPVPAPPPAPKRYLGLTLAQWTQYGSLAAPLLLPKSDTQKRARVLTSTNVQLAGYPQPSPQSFVSFGGAPPATPTRTDKCKCPPKKKRKPRARRTVCYAGTYTERANGLRKAKRRKIPCR